MPWLCHCYTGRDDNRDRFMLAPAETRAMSRAACREWFPHSSLDEHRTGSTGPEAVRGRA